VRYTHDESEFAAANSMFTDEPFRSAVPAKDDWLDLRITDGKNEATASLHIHILRTDNQPPVLISTYTTRCRELQRKQLTTGELRVTDRDTPDEQLKLIVTHPPQYGTLEKMIIPGSSPSSQPPAVSDKTSIEDKVISINTNTNQKLNVILKFTNNGTVSGGSETKATFEPVSEFSMADIVAGLIYYNHRSAGMRQDRFGFVVYDGVNSVFTIDGGQQVSFFFSCVIQLKE
jgi:hypothetical protein